MATSTGSGIVLPEPLQNDNARCWFKVCCVANSWNEAKRSAWTIYEVLTKEQTDTYTQPTQPRHRQRLCTLLCAQQQLAQKNSTEIEKL